MGEECDLDYVFDLYCSVTCSFEFSDFSFYLFKFFVFTLICPLNIFSLITNILVFRFLKIMRDFYHYVTCSFWLFDFISGMYNQNIQMVKSEQGNWAGMNRNWAGMNWIYKWWNQNSETGDIPEASPKRSGCGCGFAEEEHCKTEANGGSDGRNGGGEQKRRTEAATDKEWRWMEAGTRDVWVSRVEAGRR